MRTISTLLFASACVTMAAGGCSAQLNLNDLVKGKIKSASSGDSGFSSDKSDEKKEPKASSIGQSSIWAKHGGKCKNIRGDSFNPFQSYHRISQPSGVSAIIEVVDDLDGDGDVDIVTLDLGNANSRPVGVLVNSYTEEAHYDQSKATSNVAGGGTVDKHFKHQRISEEYRSAHSADAYDLDGDGDKDIVAGSWDSGWDNGIVVFENLGESTKWKEHWLVDETSALNLRVADLSGNKSGDFFFTREKKVFWIPTSRKPIAKWPGMKDWSEAEKLIIELPSKVSSLLAAVDIDGDGDLDIPYTISGEYNGWAASLRWLENKGRGKSWKNHIIYKGGQEIFTGKRGDLSLQAIDFDRDKDIDFLLWGTEYIFLLENKKRGKFAKSTLLSWDDATISRASAADIDMNGDTEVVAVNRRDEQLVAIDYNKGKCRRQRSLRHKMDRMEYFTMVDIDGDGDQDVLTEGSYWNGMFWVENKTK